MGIGPPVSSSVAAVVALLASVAPAPLPGQQRPAPVSGYTVVAAFPHDPNAFTQGLVYADGELYESTGLLGESTLRRVELGTGRVLQQAALPREYFGEGLALVGDALVQLTWRNGLGLVYDRKTFARRRAFPYQGEGWGLAFDGVSRLVMSDGTDRLTFLDPKTFKPVRTLAVHDAGRAIDRLNELEWIEGEIWANVWTTDRIVRITPATGAATGWIALDTLWPASERTPGADVMNGIAYDPKRRRIFVTGKKWPRVYQIAVTK